MKNNEFYIYIYLDPTKYGRYTYGKFTFKKLSDKTKNKIRIKNIGKIRTEESKIKQSISCKNTLSKIKHKLSERSKGINNSNTKSYTIKLKTTKEKVKLISREKLLIFINKYNNSNYKDCNYLLIQLKKDKIPNFSFISSYNLKHKNGFIIKK